MPYFATNSLDQLTRFFVLINEQNLNISLKISRLIELEILFADLYCISFVVLRPYESFTAHFIIVFQKISGSLTTVHFRKQFLQFQSF